MAKRQKYEIQVNGVAVSIRYAFNTANREVEHRAGELARKAGVTLRLVESETIRDEYKFAAWGRRVWASDDGAHRFEFVITRLPMA